MKARGNLNYTDAVFGLAISGQAGGKWRHPWYTTPTWRNGRWFVTVKAGLVNARAPIFQTTAKGQEAAGRDLGINPLTGKPFFSDPVFTNGENARPAERPIDIPLYHAPYIPLSFRRLGFDGLARYGVPQYFLDRGVAPAPVIDTGDLESLDVSALIPSGSIRLLRACDLILRQPRLALTSEITLKPGPLTGISNVTQTLSLRSPAAAERLRILAGTFTPPDAAIDPLAGVYEEPTWDERIISTVFLLSPEGTEIGSEPDGTWQPYVRHNLFWNLNYSPAEFRPVTTDPGIPFIPPLAAGAAQLVINFLGASLNDMTQQALNILTAHSMAGHFYTSTGGGHDAAYPLDEVDVLESQSGGLGKAAVAPVNAAKLAAAARAKRRQRLDPEFPFRAEPFDYGLAVA